MQQAIKINLLLVLLFLASTAMAQIPNEIFLGIRNGNAQELAKYMNSHVELSVEQTDDVFKIEKATQILHDFFQKNPPINLRVIHQSVQAEQSYAIIKLETENKSFQVTFLLRKKKESFAIYQLQIEESEL
ncbi:MAG: DUF4783 domain-containing protein [Mangrovibacterium sp.]